MQPELVWSFWQPSDLSFGAGILGVDRHTWLFFYLKFSLLTVNSLFLDTEIRWAIFSEEAYLMEFQMSRCGFPLKGHPPPPTFHPLEVY